MFKYDVIVSVINGKITKKAAKIKLRCSIRTIDRYIVKFKTLGIQGFIHGNRDRKPKNVISKEIKKIILNEFKSDKYIASPNVAHLCEIVMRNYNISISTTTVHKLLKENGLCSRMANRETKKKIYSLLKGPKDIKPHLHPTRSRKRFMVEMIQMDASSKVWVKNCVKWHLHLAIDDCTGNVVGAYFDTQETLNGYYNITKQMIENYGIPALIYSDKRSVFEYKKSNQTNETYTNFSYACKILGIELKTTSVPQAKGRIERLNLTFQNRLPAELALANIQTLEQANEFLKSYIAIYNSKFAHQVDDSKNVFEKQGDIDLRHILSRYSKRKILKGCVFQYKNKQYFPINEIYERQLFKEGKECLIIETLDNELYVNIDDKIYATKEVDIFEKQSKTFDFEVKKEEKKKKYIPPANHPWKLSYYSRQMNQ